MEDGPTMHADRVFRIYRYGLQTMALEFETEDERRTWRRRTVLPFLQREIGLCERSFGRGGPEKSKQNAARQTDMISVGWMRGKGRLLWADDLIGKCFCDDGD